MTARRLALPARAARRRDPDPARRHAASRALAAGWISTASVFVAFAGAVWSFFGVSRVRTARDAPRARSRPRGRGSQSGSFKVGLQLLVDPLSTMMMLIVSGVGGLIVLYSIGYMDGDDEERRYFAYMSFFVFSMLLLVEGGNLLLLLVGWGLVGLSSYLLIGFWHERPTAVAAAKKAFIMNAFGDATMALAFFVLIAHTHSLSFATSSTRHLSSTDGEPRRARPARRRGGEVGADPAPHVAAGRDGGPDSGQRPHPRGDDGHRRRLPDRAHASDLRAGAHGRARSPPAWARSRCSSRG